VVLAAIPSLAAWASGLVRDALLAAGTSAEQVGAAALANAGVLYEGLLKLGEGSVLAGMVLGTIAVFVIGRRFIHAAVACAVGGVLTLVGLIHGEEVVFFSSSPKIALGYGLAAIICLGYAALRLPPREPDASDPIDVEVAAERAPRFEREEERVAVPA
jgi:AGZA family xanthine/uracil permease-like MFS transporter